MFVVCDVFFVFVLLDVVVEWFVLFVLFCLCCYCLCVLFASLFFGGDVCLCCFVVCVDLRFCLFFAHVVLVRVLLVWLVLSFVVAVVVFAVVCCRFLFDYKCCGVCKVLLVVVVWFCC